MFRHAKSDQIFNVEVNGTAVGKYSGKSLEGGVTVKLTVK